MLLGPGPPLGVRAPPGPLGVPGGPVAWVASSISNKIILQNAGEKSLTTQLLIRQTILFGRIASQPNESLMRDAIFEPNSFTPKVFEGSRRIGRPRLTWVHVVAAYALQVTNGSLQKLRDILSSPDPVNNWKVAAKQHFS